MILKPAEVIMGIKVRLGREGWLTALKSKSVARIYDMNKLCEIVLSLLYMITRMGITDIV